MTETDWLQSTDPKAMLTFLRDSGKLSERKARLFAVACCRRIWRYLKDDRSRRLIEVAELFADDAASVKQLRTAFNRAADGQEAIHYEGGDAIDQSAAEAVLGLRHNLQMNQVFEGIAEAVEVARLTEAWERIYQSPDKDSRTQEIDELEECDTGAEAEREVQATLLRDLIGPLLFRPLTIAPAMLAWQDATLVRLARAAYEERELPSGHLDRARLGVLADALSEAGCEDASLLDHLRGPGPHWRGCFVLDWLLGKE